MADLLSPWSKPKSRLAKESLEFLSTARLSKTATKICLRGAQHSDLDVVVALEEQAYAFPWTLKNFADSIAADYDFWLLEDARTIFAYALVMWLPDEAHLLNITVRPEHQGQGLGRQFLSWILEDVSSRGAQSLMLEVRTSNPGALALYISMGFRQIGTRKGYYPSWNNTREDALVLSKPLSS